MEARGEEDLAANAGSPYLYSLKNWVTQASSEACGRWKNLSTHWLYIADGNVNIATNTAMLEGA